MKLLIVEAKKLRRIKLIPLLLFAMIVTLGIVFMQGQFSYNGLKYISTPLWYMTQVQSLATYFILPSLIALLSGYIICREETEDVLKSLKLIPVNEGRMLFAKMSITFMLSIFIYVFLFIATLIVELTLHASSLKIVRVRHFFLVYVLTGIGVFLAISPIVAIVGIVKKSYWISFIITEIYSFVAIFFASKAIIRAIYPMSSIFIFAGVYETSIVEVSISILILCVCAITSLICLKKRYTTNNELS